MSITTVILPPCFPHRVLLVFHPPKFSDVRRTSTGAWVFEGRRYRTYQLAVLSRFRGRRANA